MADQEEPPIVGVHECKICVRGYTGVGGRRVPMVMPRCGHTVCKECCFVLLQRGQNNKISCPFCRKEFYIDTVARLPHNFHALEVMEQLRAQGLLPEEQIDDAPPAAPREPAQDLPEGILLNQHRGERNPFAAPRANQQVIDEFLAAEQRANEQRRRREIIEELIRGPEQQPLREALFPHQLHFLGLRPRQNAPAAHDPLANVPNQVAIAAEALAGMEELERRREEALHRVGLFRARDVGRPRYGESGDEADGAPPARRRRLSEGSNEGDDELQVLRVIEGNGGRRRARN